MKKGNLLLIAVALLFVTASCTKENVILSQKEYEDNFIEAKAIWEESNVSDYQYSLYRIVNNVNNLQDIYVEDGDVTYVKDLTENIVLDNHDNSTTINGLFDYIDAVLTKLAEKSAVIISNLDISYHESQGFPMEIYYKYTSEELGNEWNTVIMTTGDLVQKE